MTKLFPLIQTIYNLKNIQRFGFNLFAGVNFQDLDSSAVHGFLVAELAMLIGDLAKRGKVTVNVEVLLKIALYHEWGEAVLGDYPDKSPSYQSYFEEDIRKIRVKAEQKARREMTKSTQEMLGIDYEELLTSPQYEVERELFNLADEMALLIEVIDIKFRGYERYDWFSYLWANQVEMVGRKAEKYPFLKPLLQEIKEAYQSEKKAANPYLTKPQFQKR